MKDKPRRSGESSRKRRAPREENAESRKSVGVKKSTSGADEQGENGDLLQFEDTFDDDFDSEEAEEPIDGYGAADEDAAKGATGGRQTERRVFRPGVDTIGDNEELVHDPSAYDMLHKVHVEWPALSFDFLADQIQGSRNVFPMTAYCVIGSQAQISSKNSITVMKMSQLHKTKRRRRKNKLDEDEDEAEESSDEDSDEDKKKGDPLLESYKIKHDGAINRIRSMPQQPNIVSTWSETGRVNVFDVEPAISALDRGSRMPHPNAQKPTAVKPFFVFSAHKSEGFAMDWSPLQQGRMVTGAMNRTLMSWTQREDGRFSVDPDTFRGHTDSIEDLQWSPTETDVFASCSADRSIRFWDLRVGKKSALTLSNAHEMDVNVISWNRIDSHLLVSGGDEGGLKVWDLRSVKDGESLPAAFFGYHRKPITSVEWHPTLSSMLAGSSEDHTVSLWDLSVERDPEEEATLGEVLPGAEDLPPQLMFLHMGQKNIKEVHWHRQLPSVLMSTAEDGLNIFRAADIW
mmetsp:Transcript_2359/g.3473  ORF Transcript_2359/g.3473 Transcript_2359/m.3473 type:complete len:516 (-) Transcript_2359:381-1928(-)